MNGYRCLNTDDIELSADEKKLQEVLICIELIMETDIRTVIY